jgi:hypothetical protein
MRNYRIMYEASKLAKELLKEHNRTLVELVELRLLRSGAQQVTEAASLLAVEPIYKLEPTMGDLGETYVDLK